MRVHKYNYGTRQGEYYYGALALRRGQNNTPYQCRADSDHQYHCDIMRAVT